MQFTQSIISKFQFIKIYLRILCKNSLTSLNWFCCRRMKNMRIHRGSIKCSWHIKIGSFSNINRIENCKSNLFVKKIKPAFRCNTIRKNNQKFWSGFESASIDSSFTSSIKKCQFFSLLSLLIWLKESSNFLLLYRR